jgi:hypothetical protein
METLMSRRGFRIPGPFTHDPFHHIRAAYIFDNLDIAPGPSSMAFGL